MSKELIPSSPKIYKPRYQYPFVMVDFLSDFYSGPALTWFLSTLHHTVTNNFAGQYVPLRMNYSHKDSIEHKLMYNLQGNVWLTFRHLTYKNLPEGSLTLVDGHIKARIENESNMLKVQDAIEYLLHRTCEEDL